MKLKFKAQKASGEFYEAEREAADKFVLARELRAEGETLLYAAEKAAHHSFDLKSLPVFGRVSIHDKIIFARNLGGMLAAGLPLSRALNVLERQTSNAKLKGIIASVNTKISTGSSLSAALGDFGTVFPSIMVFMIKAGEEGGNLASALSGIADQLDKTYALERKIRGALMYPAVVITVMIVIGILMFIFIVPELTKTFAELNTKLPFSTRVVVGISDFIRNNTTVGLVGLAILVGGLWVSAKSVQGKRAIDYVLLRIPIISPLIKQANAARTGQTLSSLLSSGVEVVTALGITADVMSNSYYKDVLLKAREAIQKGDPISSVFREAESIYPPFLSEMVAVGEETGKLSNMLKETGTFFETEVEQKTKDLSTIIEPVLMVVVGVAVGFFAVAMISPAYSLMNSI